MSTLGIHVDRWAQNNNLSLNKAKSVEIIFTDRKRKLPGHMPPQIPEIRRDTTIKILGVTMTNHLSAGEHVRDVIGKCAQSLHALKLLRFHGSDDSLRLVYKAVVLSKLQLYASPAWWGFTSAADKQRLKAAVRRAIRLGLYTADDLMPSQLAEDMDDNLFANILNNSCHVLYSLLPNNTEHTYNLRPRRHSLSLTVKTNCKNFVYRLLLRTFISFFSFTHGCILPTVYY